jgi:hypothetical protein
VYFSQTYNPTCSTCGGAAKAQKQRTNINNNYLNIEGYDGISYSGIYTWGFKVNCDLICSDAELFCQAKTLLGDSFALYVLYSTGIKLIESATFDTDRFNSVTIDKEALTEQRNHYLQKMQDLRKRLVNDFKGTLATIDRQCIICEGLTLNYGR